MGAEASQCLRRWPASIATEPCETASALHPCFWPSMAAPSVAVERISHRGLAWA